ncbi:MAG: hypothetical protein Q9183_004912 [Haloplaca sp. 2 TL-2023]
MSGCYYSSSSSFYKRSSSPWTSKDRLTGGTEWHSDMVRAQVALTFIALLVLPGITIWSFTIQKRGRGRLFLPAIVLNFIAYLWTAISTILTEECASVAGVYAIFSSIFSHFQSLGLIVLLAGIFNELVNSSKLMSTQFMMIHLGYCGVLFLIWLASLCLDLATTIQYFEGTGSGLDQRAMATYRLDLALSALYLVAALYILVRAVMHLAWPQNKDKKASTITLTLIAIPLLVVAIWNLAIDAIIYHTLTRAGADLEDVFNAIFAGFVFVVVCIITIFVGLVLVMKMNAYSDDGLGPTPIPQKVQGAGHWDRQSMRDHSQDPIYNGP